VYAIDAYRGLDVLKIKKGGRDSQTKRAPIPQQWYTGAGIDAYRPSSKFGYSCPIPTRKLLGD
jgi:hypothetical protein